MHNALNQLSLYNATGGTPIIAEEYLKEATHWIGSATAHLADQGLAAFDAYPVAFGVQLNIYEERIKRLGTIEKKAVVVLIEKIAMTTTDDFKATWTKKIQDGSHFDPFLEGFIVKGFGFPENYAHYFPDRETANDFAKNKIAESIAALNAGPFAKLEAVRQQWITQRNQYI